MNIHRLALSTKCGLQHIEKTRNFFYFTCERASDLKSGNIYFSQTNFLTKSANMFNSADKPNSADMLTFDFLKFRTKLTLSSFESLKIF